MKKGSSFNINPAEKDVKQNAGDNAEEAGQVGEKPKPSSSAKKTARVHRKPALGKGAQKVNDICMLLLLLCILSLKLTC